MWSKRGGDKKHGRSRGQVLKCIFGRRPRAGVSHRCLESAFPHCSGAKEVKWVGVRQGEYSGSGHPKPRSGSCTNLHWGGCFRKTLGCL